MSETEQHDAFGTIGAFRVSHGPPGAVLFDSDIRHHHTVQLRISRAERGRDLNRDWIHERKNLIEVEMSEAQWAAFVSSMNTSGVPCTLRRVGGEDVPRLDYSPRLEKSMRETREAADRAFAEIVEAARVFEETPSTPAAAKRAAWATLWAKINNASANVEYAGKSLSAHAENVVQKARADIETMLVKHAERLGIETGSTPTLALEAGSEENE